MVRSWHISETFPYSCITTISHSFPLFIDIIQIIVPFTHLPFIPTQINTQINQWVKKENSTGRKNEHTHTILYRHHLNQPKHNGKLRALWWLRTHNNTYQYINIRVTKFNRMINQPFCQTQREQQSASLLHVDNESCIAMANAGKPTSCTQHNDIKYHEICEWVERDLMLLEHILIIPPILQDKDQLKNSKVREHVQQDIFDLLIWYDSSCVLLGREPDICCWHCFKDGWWNNSHSWASRNTTKSPYWNKDFLLVLWPILCQRSFSNPFYHTHLFGMFPYSCSMIGYIKNL